MPSTLPETPFDPTVPDHRRDAVLLSTFFVRFAFGLTVSVFAAYLTGSRAGLGGADIGTVGWVTAAAPIGEFSTVLLSGLHADRYGRFPVLFAGILGAAGLFFAISFTQSAVPLVVLNLVYGVASGAILAASLAVIADGTAADRRGLEMGRFDAVNLLGWIVGFAVGFAALGTLPISDLPWLFRGGAALLAVGFVVAFWLARGVRETRHLRSFQFEVLVKAIAQRDILLVTMPWLVIYMLIGTAFVFLGSASTAIGVPALWLGAAIGIGGGLLLFTQPFYGRLADRYGRWRLMVVGVFGFLLVLAGVAAAGHYGPRPEIVGVIAVGAIAALAYGPSALAALTDASRHLTRATTMSVYSLAISLGMLLGLLLSTQLYDHYNLFGLDVFFLAVGAGLTVLTVIRGFDVRSGRVAA
ncbi:MAG: MFS transporter [Thermoplasmata archaeon]|nr:MFS transporter [Thermoplasmata archaeon]